MRQSNLENLNIHTNGLPFIDKLALLCQFEFVFIH